MSRVQATITCEVRHGLEWHRLLVFVSGKLVLSRSHASKGGAMECYRHYLRTLKGE